MTYLSLIPGTHLAERREQTPESCSLIGKKKNNYLISYVLTFHLVKVRSLLFLVLWLQGYWPVSFLMVSCL